jgi:hypothetical protein
MLEARRLLPAERRRTRRYKIKAARIHNPVKLYPMAEAALGGHMEAVVRDLPDAETKQRLGMFTGKRS